jgi:hypothetical protein
MEDLQKIRNGGLGEDAYVAISSNWKSKRLGRDTESSQVAEVVKRELGEVGLRPERKAVVFREMLCDYWLL